MPTFADIAPDYPDMMTQPWFGVVSKDAVDFTDMLMVTIPAFDENLEWGPMRWQSRDATSLPSVGDHCLVVFDDERNGWVVAWWPYG